MPCTNVTRIDSFTTARKEGESQGWGWTGWIFGFKLSSRSGLAWNLDFHWRFSRARLFPASNPAKSSNPRRASPLLTPITSRKCEVAFNCTSMCFTFENNFYFGEKLRVATWWLIRKKRTFSFLVPLGSRDFGQLKGRTTTAKKASTRELQRHQAE